MGDRRPAVLVVDDNRDFLRVMRAVLGRGQPTFDVHTVETGTDALAFLERQPPYDGAPRPQFVVLDFLLPDMKAPAVLVRLHAQADLRPIPVLVLSQAGWEQDEAAARAAGASEFRLKPSRVGALRDAVVSFWEEHVHGISGPPHRG
jgi:CheY-like chemotaxis protein